MSNTKLQTRKLVLGAILTALVIVLQLLGSFIRFGQFSISLVLIPIVIGAATCGIAVGGWLGFVFGVAVILSGDAAAFWSIDVFGTILTVLVKGIGCGLVAGAVYKLIARFNKYLAVAVAAIACPVVNTGIFLLGCRLFFMDSVAAWGIAEGYTNMVTYMFLVLVGANFLFELGTNIVLSPVIVRILNFEKKQ